MDHISKMSFISHVPLKEQLTKKMKIQSLNTLPHADGRWNEVSQRTKRLWSFTAILLYSKTSGLVLKHNKTELKICINGCIQLLTIPLVSHPLILPIKALHTLLCILFSYIISFICSSSFICFLLFLLCKLLFVLTSLNYPTNEVSLDHWNHTQGNTHKGNTQHQKLKLKRISFYYQ